MTPTQAHMRAHTHIYMYVYTYIYIYNLCMCVLVWESNLTGETNGEDRTGTLTMMGRMPEPTEQVSNRRWKVLQFTFSNFQLL